MTKIAKPVREQLDYVSFFAVKITCFSVKRKFQPKLANLQGRSFDFEDNLIFGLKKNQIFIILELHAETINA